MLLIKDYINLFNLVFIYDKIKKNDYKNIYKDIKKNEQYFVD